MMSESNSAVAYDLCASIELHLAAVERIRLSACSAEPDHEKSRALRKLLCRMSD